MKRTLILVAALGLQACATLGGLRDEPLTAGVNQEFQGSFEDVLAAARVSLSGAGFTIEDDAPMPSGARLLLGSMPGTFWCDGVVARVIVDVAESEGRERPGNPETVVRIVSKKRTHWNMCRGDYSTSILSGISAGLETGLGAAVTSPAERVTRSFGSGFILPSRTVAATNHHVIQGGRSVEVWSPSEGEWLPSRVIRVDPANDLALVAVPETLRPPETTPVYGVQGAQDIRVGEEVHAIGFPTQGVSGLEGARARFTTGTISADVGFLDDPRLVQITAPIQPGNSGGPLVNAYGQITGVIVASINSILFLERTGAMPQNVNFAIKIDYLRLLAGIDFGTPGDAPIAEMSGSDVAQAIEPWVIQIRVTQD